MALCAASETKGVGLPDDLDSLSLAKWQRHDGNAEPSPGEALEN